MNLQQILGSYIDKFGEEHDINTALLSEEAEEDLSNMLQASIQSNKPIPLKELNDFFGFDTNKPDILI